MFIGPLPSTAHGADNTENTSSLVITPVYWPVPSTGHGANHTENTSSNTFLLLLARISGIA
jgi:hypothetical protein